MHGARAQNVSTRRNGPRPETRPTGPRPRHIAPRPRRDVSTFRDRLETETSRPRPHPCAIHVIENVFFLVKIMKKTFANVE